MNVSKLLVTIMRYGDRMESRFLQMSRWLHLSSKCRCVSKVSTARISKLTESQLKKLSEETEAEHVIRAWSDHQRELLRALEIELEVLNTTSQLELSVERVRASEWVHMVTQLNSMSERVAYLTYLNQKMLRIERRVEKTSREDKDRENVVEEDIHSPVYLQDVHTARQIAQQRRNKAAQAMLTGNSLVIDLDFEMTDHEERKVLEDFRNCYSAHSHHLHPFNLYVTGLQNRPIFQKHLERGGSLCNLLVNFYRESFTDLFPIEDLVYLSARGKSADFYSGDKVYVIGGLPISRRHDQVADVRSFVKAKQLKIPSVSLPIPQNFKYTERFFSRDLTINKTYQIMMDINLHHDWKAALTSNLDPNKFVPRDSTIATSTVSKGNNSAKIKTSFSKVDSTGRKVDHKVVYPFRDLARF